MIRYLLTGFTLMLFLISAMSCRKAKKETLASASVNTGVSARINDIHIVSDSLWIAAAGIRNESGFFLQSTDQGNSWEIEQTQFPRSIYCVEINQKGFGLAGGDYLDLWQTDDYGATWNYYWLGNQVPFNEEDRPGVRDILLIDDSTWTFCGGENLGEGVIYRTGNRGVNWSFSFHQHEFRGSTLNTQGKIVVGGHGKILIYRDDVENFSTGQLSDVFITSVRSISSGALIACSFDGKLLRSETDGLSWKEIYDVNKGFTKRINWNCLTQDQNNLICCGTDGFIAISSDEGKSWELKKIETPKNLITAEMFKGQLIAGDTEGDVHLIDLSDQ